MVPIYRTPIGDFAVGLYGVYTNSEAQTKTRMILRGGRDLKNQPGGELECSGVRSGRDFRHLRVVEGEADAPECSEVQLACNPVTRGADPVADALERALREWGRDRDAQAVRRILLQLLAVL
jgi:hypothetical protein